MLHVFTFATDTNKLSYLKDSANLSNLNINYIMKESWNGYFDKIKYIKEVIKDIDENDIVCFIDAYDVLSLSSELEIIQKFKDYNCELLIGSEINCWPETYKDLYPVTNHTTNYKYVNSGGYIGYKYAIWNLMSYKTDYEIQQICKTGSDQAYFIEYYINNHSNKIKLDCDQKIFQNMHLVSWNEFTIRNGRIINNILNETPCFIHFNGATWQTHTKENILPILVNKITQSTQNINTDYNLNDYEQIITPSCWPHKQIN
jgi:hypothetical protein